MGTIRNEMTIVHHYDKDELEIVRKDAIKVFSKLAGSDEEHITYMISPIMETYINQEYAFVINGDCSKIGWETSKRFHKARMEWCEKHKHDVQNIVVINFGEGDEPCCIVFDNKSESEEQEYRKIESIPYLMHKELDVPISECQKAYDVAIDYLQSQGKVKG